MPSDIQPILDKALDGERLTSEDCTALLESPDFVRIGLAADEIRQRKNDPSVVTYIIDRNINYTNVCNVVCTFCAFYRRPGKPDTYVHSIDEICNRIDETIALGGGGGEILDDEVRKRVSTKCNTQEWLDVMRAVHKVGLISTATMMFGIGDRIEHRVRHLQRIRDLQDETGGFTAFIPWTFQRENTDR